MNFYSVVSTDESYKCSCSAVTNLVLTQLFEQKDLNNNKFWFCQSYYMCKDCFLAIKYNNNWSLVTRKFLDKMKKRNESLSRA